MKYSTSPEIQEQAELLIAEGWTPKMGGKHWKLYTPDGKLRIAIPGSPSDHRSYLNWLRDIRRIKRGQKIGVRDVEYVAKPQTTQAEIERFKNQPRVVVESEKKQMGETMHEQKLAVPVPEFQKIDAGGIELAKDLVTKAFRTLDQVAHILNERGYRTAKGNPFTKEAVGAMLRQNGLRQRRFRKDKRHYRAFERERDQGAEVVTLEGKKPFDQEAFDLATRMLAEGTKYREACQRLSDLGYLTARGLPLNEPRLRTMMARWGLQVVAQKPAAPMKSVAGERAPTPSEAKKSAGVLNEVEELISSNLSESFKERHLIMLAREWSEKGLLK